MASLTEIFEKVKDLVGAVKEWSKSNGSIVSILALIGGSFGYSYTHFEKKIDDIGSIPAIRRDGEKRDSAFKVMETRFDTMGLGFEAMHKSYRKDTAEFRAAVRPLVTALDTLRRHYENVSSYEDFMLTNRMFVEELFERVEKLEDGQ